MAAYLTTTEAAQLLRLSVRSLHEAARHRTVPHRRLPGQRRLLFLETELEQHLDGAPLEVTELAAGGRVVKPVSSSRKAAA